MKIKDKLFSRVESTIDEHDPFFYDSRERAMWSAINALQELVDEKHIEEYEWRIKEVINCLKGKI